MVALLSFVAALAFLVTGHPWAAAIMGIIWFISALPAIIAVISLLALR